VTTSDAPQPPGGPQRQDAPDGPLQPSGNEQNALPDPEQGSDDAPGSVPPVQGEPEQSDAAADLQEENAGTTLDQPSQ
jgi:hypothetical protein